MGALLSFMISGGAPGDDEDNRLLILAFQIYVLFILSVRKLILAALLIYCSSTTLVRKVIMLNAYVVAVAVLLLLFLNSDSVILMRAWLVLFNKILAYLFPETQTGMIPKVNYGSLKLVGQGYMCGICLELIKDEDEVRLLGSCKHYYHISCIDPWLQRSKHCPICRRDVAHQSAKIRFVLWGCRVLKPF